MSASDRTTKTVCIYVLQRISDKAYLYIGSAVNPRVRFNHHRFDNPYPIVKEAFANDDIRFIVITETDESHRIETEAKLWHQFKDAGHPIVNDEPRPYGGSYANRSRSEITREKISKSSTGHKRWLGRHHSEESKNKMANSKKGTLPSEESKRRSSEVNKGNTHFGGRHHTEESKQKISAATKGRYKSEETRRKIGEANGRRGQTEETRQKLSQIHTGMKSSDETKRKISEAGKARWARIRKESGQ